MSDDLKSTLERYSSAAIIQLATYQRVAPKGKKFKGELIESLVHVLSARDD